MGLRQSGTIKMWKDDKGYGFIRPDGGGQDVYAHISGFGGAPRDPVKGDKVEYTLTMEDRGPRAEEISFA